MAEPKARMDMWLIVTRKIELNKIRSDIFDVFDKYEAVSLRGKRNAIYAKDGIVYYEKKKLLLVIDVPQKNASKLKEELSNIPNVESLVVFNYCEH